MKRRVEENMEQGKIRKGLIADGTPSSFLLVLLSSPPSLVTFALLFGPIRDPLNGVKKTAVLVVEVEARIETLNIKE